MCRLGIGWARKDYDMTKLLKLNQNIYYGNGFDIAGVASSILATPTKNSRKLTGCGAFRYEALAQISRHSRGNASSCILIRRRRLDADPCSRTKRDRQLLGIPASSAARKAKRSPSSLKASDQISAIMRQFANSN